MTTVEQLIKGFISTKLRCSFSGLARITPDLIHDILNLTNFTFVTYTHFKHTT